MSGKVNPFRPGHPIGPGMFAGRLNEIHLMQAALRQTKAGRPSNLMIIGERGIGKSSLLLVAQALAKVNTSELGPFLVVDTDLDVRSTQLGLVKKIEMGLRRNLSETEKARSFLKEAWEFLQRIEAHGFGLKPEERGMYQKPCWKSSPTA